MMCPRLGFVFMLYALCLLVCTGDGAEIINGKDVAPHSMPFMALLENNKGPTCGGTLISPNWVLTAAHCFGIKRVILGAHHIRKQEMGSRIIRAVTKQIMHHDYNPKTFLNDFMLLKLDKPVRETKTVRVLSVLNERLGYPSAGSTCMVAGWGRTENTSFSDVLRAVRVTVIDLAKCNSPHYYNHNPFITSGQICAGSNGYDIADTCQGDSGGPLLCGGKLVGVTSFGIKCGLINKPGVYGFLSKNILKWIKIYL